MFFEMLGYDLCNILFVILMNAGFFCTISYLPVPLVQNPKLEIRRHSVFIKCSYEFWSLRDEWEREEL